MPSARYWRIVAIDTVGRADLALSEFALYEAGVRVDSAGMLSAPIAPSSGAVADLSDASNSAEVRWLRERYTLPGFSLTFDLGAAKTVNEIRIGAGANQDDFPHRFDVHWSDTGTTWTTGSSSAVGINWPGANSTATLTGDMSVLSGLTGASGVARLTSRADACPQLASPYLLPSFLTRPRNESLQLRMDYGGDGKIIDTVKKVGTPSNVPVRRRVFCMEALSGTLVADTWSDEITGIYAFYNLDRSRKYTVFSYDHTLVHRATIADGLTPEKMS